MTAVLSILLDDDRFKRLRKLEKDGISYRAVIYLIGFKWNVLVLFFVRITTYKRRQVIGDAGTP